MRIRAEIKADAAIAYKGSCDGQRSNICRTERARVVTRA
jgi:hypothetical protein